MLGTYAFDAFGLRTGTDSTTDPYAGFGGGCGYYADAETGLSLLGHRYYDTGTGRFINRDPIGYAGGADLYSYTQNNPIIGADPSGYSYVPDASSAYDYWMNVAVDGESAGGLGSVKAFGASVMTGFIDFFGARNVQRDATASGSATGNGDTGGAVAYGAAAAGEIALAATAGWTGGGGSGAIGVRLSEVGWYELGSQTLHGDVFQRLAAQGLAADKVTLGKTLWQTYKWRKVLLPGFFKSELTPGTADWLKTFPQGPTPGGYAGMMLVRTGVQQFFAPGKGRCGN